MDPNVLNALFGLAVAAHSAASDLKYGYTDWVLEYKDRLDPLAHRDLQKRLRDEYTAIKDVIEDVKIFAHWTSTQIQKSLQERVQKAWYLREKDEWDIKLVNRAVLEMQALAVITQDLAEYAASVELPPELAPSLENLQTAHDRLMAFKDGSFTDLVRALDDMHVLHVTDKMVEVDEEQQERQEQLAIALSGGKAPGQSEAVKKSAPAIIVPSKSDWRSAGVQIFKEAPRVNPETNETEYRFKTQFVAKSVDMFRGMATGIVMPVGRPDRTYLDGDYFPRDVVEFCYFDWILNSPKINRHHASADTFNFWEHPEFMVAETYLARSAFELNGDMVEPGDWVATLIARTEESRQQMREGVFNGFSVEGWVTYFPDELLAQ